MLLLNIGNLENKKRDGQSRQAGHILSLFAHIFHWYCMDRQRDRQTVKKRKETERESRERVRVKKIGRVKGMREKKESSLAISMK